MRPLKGPRPLPPPFFFSPSSLFRSRSAEIRRGQSRNFKGFRLRIRVISYINYAIRCLAFSKSSLIRTSRGDELHIHSLKAVSRIYLFNARSSTIFARHPPRLSDSLASETINESDNLFRESIIHRSPNSTR